MDTQATQVVQKFWQQMQTNNFRSVGLLLSDDFVLEFPQSRERLRGRHNFALFNEEYPAHGPWQFVINRLIGNEHEAVSDVSVTDGVQKARAISFFTVRDGKIVKMVEFWPEGFEAPKNRKHLVEPLL